MTLIVALKTDQAIILASDSRGTVGDPRGLTAINDGYQKIHPVGNCGLGIAGASELGTALLDELRKNNIDTVANIDDAVTRIVRESAELFTRWFREIPAMQRPAVVITLAGYRFVANKPPEALIYLLNSQLNFAPQLMGDSPCLSGVPQYAVYLVHRYYDRRISIAKGKGLAEYLIAETASQDPKVGGSIQMAEITSTNYRQLSEQEVADVHRENDDLNAGLRQFFLRGVVAP